MKQLELGVRLRDGALECLKAAHGPFIDRVCAWILAMPSGHEFTSDDLWPRAYELPQGVRPTEPRAMGAALQQAAKRGLICSTARYQRSARPECHARPVLVWRRT